MGFCFSFVTEPTPAVALYPRFACNAVHVCIIETDDGIFGVSAFRFRPGKIDVTGLQENAQADTCCAVLCWEMMDTGRYGHTHTAHVFVYCAAAIRRTSIVASVGIKERVENIELLVKSAGQLID